MKCKTSYSRQLLHALIYLLHLCSRSCLRGEYLSRSHALRGNAVKARCAASRGQQVEMQSISKQDAARPILHSHAARGNEEFHSSCLRGEYYRLL
jgi:hypothetical protein